MRLWVDDLRIPSERWDVWARTPSAAITILSTGCVEEISLDHDLGGDLTGYQVATYIEQKAAIGDFKVPKWHIHSANPVGRARMEAALRRAERFEREQRIPE